EGDYTPEGVADDLATLLEQLQIERVDIVGHSWGSALALTFALRHPEHAGRLGITAAWCFSDQLWPYHHWMQVGGVGEAIVGLMHREQLGYKVGLEYTDPLAFVTQPAVEHVKASLDQPGALAAVLAVVRGMAHYEELERSYSKIQNDTLLIWGTED